MRKLVLFADGKHGLIGAAALALLIAAPTCTGCSGQPVATPTATPAPSAVPMSTTPTAAPPAEAASSTPRPAPAATLQPIRLPAGTIALYGVGEKQSLDLYALGADGSATGLGVQLPPGSLASHDGRWLVHLDAPGPAARAMVLDDLQDGRRYTIPLGVDCSQENCIVGLWAFDREGTRLASVEVAMDRWALVVVDLRDGSSRRFEATRAEGGAYPMPPGAPLGWAATSEPLLNTFHRFSEGGDAGVWAFPLPAGGSSAAIASLNPRQLLAAGAYRCPQLSPDGVRLLYLVRDREYTPAGYTLNGGFEDVAVNQLWSLEPTGRQATKLVEVSDGGALASAVAWLPDRREALFAEGRYADGQRLTGLTLKAVGASGAVREIGALPAQGQIMDLRWCRPGLALATLYVGDGVSELHTVDLVTGRTAFVGKGQQIGVLGTFEGAGPLPTPDVHAAEVFTVYTSTSTSPDGLWSTQTVSALPNVNGECTGDRYYTRLTLTRAGGAVAWTPVDEWSNWGLGFTTPEPFHWSRDGRYLYFTNLPHPDGCPYFVNGYDLQRLDLQDGQVTQVAPGLGLWLALSPDERTLAAACAGRLVLRDLATGVERRLDLPVGDGYSPAGGIAWSPDGTSLVLAVATGVCLSGEVQHSILRVDATTLVTQTLIEPDNRWFVPQAWPEPGRVLLADKDKGQWWMDAASGKVTRVE